MAERTLNEGTGRGRKSYKVMSERFWISRMTRLPCALLLSVTAVIAGGVPAAARQSKRAGNDPVAEPAVSAILAAFDKFQVVAIPEGHGMQDEDAFLLNLIRNPGFSDRVNDIEVECGNSLYQPVLDRYIAGEEVPFAEVRKVWRNTTQTTCGTWAFFEQFFPLVRAINQKLPAEKRLRVLAGDPPIDWELVKEPEDAAKFFNRDATIATIMEREVLARHRKALMLFGLFHLLHGVRSAVSIYEKDYPNATYVISGLGIFEADLPTLAGSSFASWPVPSLVRAKGTWLGGLDLSHFVPAPTMLSPDCSIHTGFPKQLQRPMEDYVDAFLYLGPQSLKLKEKMPAEVALDTEYMKELERRESVTGWGVGGLQDFLQHAVANAENPLLVVPKPPDPNLEIQACLERKKSNKSPQ